MAECGGCSGSGSLLLPDCLPPPPVLLPLILLFHHLAFTRDHQNTPDHASVQTSETLHWTQGTYFAANFDEVLTVFRRISGPFFQIGRTVDCNCNHFFMYKLGVAS